MSDEPKYDDDELAQAAALADALAQRTRPREVADALDAADVVALLKGPTLGDERASAVLASVEQAIERQRSSTRARWMIASSASALAIAAAALLMVRSSEPSASEAPVTSVPAEAPRTQAPRTEPPRTEPPRTEPPASAGGAPKPSPTAAALRESQIAWLASPSPQAQGALDHALAAYRAAQLDELERRYAR